MMFEILYVYVYFVVFVVGCTLDSVLMYWFVDCGSLFLWVFVLVVGV